MDRPHLEVDGGVESIFGVGDWNALEISEGMTLGRVGLNIVALEDPHFLQYAKRNGVTGELSWLTFKVGYIKGAVQYQAVIQDCKLDTISIRCDAGGRVTGDAAAVGGKVVATAVDPGAMSFLSSRAYRWFEMTWDEVADLLAFEFNVRNNLTPQPVIAGSGTTRDPDRKWDYLDEGRADIEGRLSYLLADAALDLQACLLSGADHVMTFQSCGDISPAQVMTLTINGLKARSSDLQIPAEGNILWEVPYMATDWTLAG